MPDPGGLSDERTRPGSSTRHSRRSDHQRERERSACAALPRAMRVPLERSPFSRLADRLPADVESKSSRTLDAIIVVAQGPRYHSLIGIPGGTRRGFPSVLAYLRAFHPKVASPARMGHVPSDLQRHLDRWQGKEIQRLAIECERGLVPPWSSLFGGAKGQRHGVHDDQSHRRARTR